MSVRVTDVHGRTWVVRRQWVARLGPETLWGRFRRRFRRHADERSGDGLDVSDPGWLDVLDDNLLAGIALLIGLVLFVLFGWPLVLALLDLVLVLLLAFLGVVARVVLRRPWTVEARAVDDGELRTWRVVGWRASGEHARAVEAGLRSGIPVP